MTAANAPIPSSVENERRAHEPSMEEILASIRKIIADDDALPLSRPSAPPRLFETNVTSIAAPAVARESAPPPPDEPARPEPAIAAAVAEPEETIPAVRQENRLDETEMASFVEVGQTLTQLDAPAEEAIEATIAEAIEPDDALRPALDIAEPAASAAADFEDAEVSPVPHEEIYAEAAEEEPLEPETPLVDDAREEVDYAPAGRARFESPETGAMLSAEANASVASAFQALSASVQMAGAESIDRHVREMLRPMLKQWLDDNLPVMVERLVRAEIERVARGGR